MELGFHVTLVRDGTAARTHEALHATLNIDGPTFAHEILTTAELVSAIRRSTPADKPAA
jgi:nicotinamidase-related amidase